MVARKTKKTGAKKTRKTASKSKTTKKAAAKKKPVKRAAAKSRTSKRRFRIKVRMYRQGLGDCFLITIPRKKGKPFYLLIDCGVILGTAKATDIMTEVVEHIIDSTGGHIDLVAATHEHWDHISGFGQAKELWTDKSRLTVGQVCLSWAENKADPLAKRLRKERHGMRMALQGAAARMRLGGNTETAEDVSNLLSFFAAAGTTSDALDVVKSLSPDNLTYCTPSDKPVKLPGTDVRMYVLGPPPDEKLIKKYNPSKKGHETYHMDAENQFVDLFASTPDADRDSPFGEQFQIPLNVAEQMPFFQQRYWGENEDSIEKSRTSSRQDKDPIEKSAASSRQDEDPIERSQAWRRIDADWLDSSEALALQLDSATNNTCLVLALELANGDVLLFAADAQVGNWLSWQDLKWKVDGKEVTGPDLLERTIFYKVGHHGSHNATLSELGLEKMTSLKLAFVPVDKKMAVKKRWNAMPLNSLMKRLNEKTNECVVRIDADVPAKLKKSMESEKLFHEVIL
jgi:hypothetical protein